MDLNKIKKLDWYRQETEIVPYYGYTSCRACVEYFHSSDKIFWLCNDHNARGYMEKSFLCELAEKHLHQEKIRPGYSESLFKKWDKDIKQKNKALFNKVSNINIEKLSNSALLDLNHKLASQSYKLLLHFYMDIFDVDAEGLIERELVEAKVNLDEQEHATMMMADKLLVYQCAELNLLKICQKIKQTPSALNTFIQILAPENVHRLKLFTAIKKEIEQHQIGYFWIYNSWGNVRTISVFDFVDSIKQILSGPRDISREIKELENFEKDIKVRKNLIIKKHKMTPWLVRMFTMFSLLLYWRDERKSQVQQMNYCLDVMGKEIAKRSHLTWEDLALCNPLEIKSLPVRKDAIKRSRDLFAQRYMMVWDGKKVEHLPKKSSQRLFKTLEDAIQKEVGEIRGMIACPGKARGEVVIINRADEFKKMAQGKILVSSMTRPDFVPLMKKAAAIVTDEGGITSHAAVVSRELKVPCVIGTQVVTKILHDGDKVFVNADHGIVIIEETKK